MRFIVKQNNGAWKVFDTLCYEDVAVFLLTSEAEAIKDCAYRNRRIA